MNILIIGCGKLGLRLAEILKEHGTQIWALKRHPKDLPDFIRVIQGDLHCPPIVEWTIFDLIYIIVSPDQRHKEAYQLLYEKHLPALAGIFGQVLTKSQKIIFVSSTHVYSENQGNWVNKQTAAEAYDYRSAALLTAEKSLVDSHIGTQIVRFSGLYDQNSLFLLEQLKGNTLITTDHYTNRIHREDAARFLAYLSVYSGNKSLFLASDNLPTKREELLCWLADQCQLPEPRLQKNQISGKRCDNQSILEIGFEFLYPNYQVGYQQLIAKFKAQKA